MHELGQFGQNQFFQFSELERSIYGRTSPAGQFWQMVSALSWKFNMASAANLENKQTSNKAYRKTKYHPKKLKVYLWTSILKLYLQYSYWVFLRVPDQRFWQLF